MTDEKTPEPGLYRKFDVRRVIGEDKPGEQFFVLSPTHDPLARVALRAYAQEAEAAGLDELSEDIFEGLDRVEAGGPFYV